MLTTTINPNLSMGYLGQQVNSTGNQTKDADSSEAQKKGEDRVTLSEKAQDLKQTYQTKETAVEQTYATQSQQLEREYLQEKSQLETEFRQKRSALGINVYA